jgi:hypothetical protein
MVRIHDGEFQEEVVPGSDAVSTTARGGYHTILPEGLSGRYCK